MRSQTLAPKAETLPQKAQDPLRSLRVFGSMIHDLEFWGLGLKVWSFRSKLWHLHTLPVCACKMSWTAKKDRRNLDWFTLL